MHAIAGSDQYLDRSAQIVRFLPAVESVGEEYDLAGGGVADRIRFAKRAGMPDRQRAACRHAHDLFAELGQPRDTVAQVQQPAEPGDPGRIAWQVRDEFVAQATAVAGVIVVKEFHFHLGHVDAGRAFALTALAAHAFG
jgi:hypothetical protein